VAWAGAGLRLLATEDSTPAGLLMLGGLLLKLAAETVSGSCFLLRPEGWQALPAAHLWGTFLGLSCALPARFRRHHA
jgi:hypothetical protein